MSDDCFVYIIAAEVAGPKAPVKIGISDDVSKRLRTLQTACPYKLSLVHSFIMPNRDIAREIEECFHTVQAEYRSMGEWFELNPITALQLMVVCIQAAFAVNAPDLSPNEMNLINELCGMDSARLKLSEWLAPRTLQ